MATQLNNLDTRISVLHSVLTDNTQQQAVASALQTANGNWAAARACLTELPPATLTKLDGRQHSCNHGAGQPARCDQPA